MPYPGLQFHLYVVIPRRQVADIRIKLEPRVIQVVCVAERLADGVHQRGIHDLHRQRNLRAACHLNTLFQTVTETTARFVICLLVIDVISRQLNHPDADILREADSFTHDFQPLVADVVIFAA